MFRACMESHSITEEIPKYLRPYIAHQDPTLYTFIDHAAWRFILKVSKAFFIQNAHQKYLDGLRQTGISTERVPLIEEMDRCLRKFQWRAVPVVGFIPPAVFTEFLSLGILPIACDMRTIEHLAYTPAPDIVHEAAGHAPIIADPEYADYLRSYGEISRKAIFSSADMEVYQAIRSLSDIKEDPSSTKTQVEAAEQNLIKALASQTYVSEATYLSRMGWWTFEYGLVGSLSQPKIYGAGLLSSISESYHCFDSAVKKVPFSIDCIEMTYDITRPQPQLYVAQNFQELKRALGELGNRMAFRMGGIEGLQRALQAKALITVELDTGVQVSGVLTEFKKSNKGEPTFIKFSGPTQISFRDQEIHGQGADYHREGFSSPLAEITQDQAAQLALKMGESVQLDFESGISLSGKLKGVVSKERRPIILTFQDCKIIQGDEVLFQPEWGTFDLVCGKNVVSVFGGAADRGRYLEATGGFHQDPARQKTNLTSKNRELNELYARVRAIRENLKSSDQSHLKDLTSIHQDLERSYPNDWLLRYELLELSVEFKLSLPFEQSLRTKLQSYAGDVRESIQRGMHLLNGEIKV